MKDSASERPLLTRFIKHTSLDITLSKVQKESFSQAESIKTRTEEQIHEYLNQQWRRGELINYI